MSREYDEVDDDYAADELDDDRPRRRLRRSTSDRPGKVQAIAIMTLIGGIYALVHGLGFVAGSFLWCCLWPGTYYAIVMGILAIIKGSQLLGKDAALQAPPKGTAIMMIINIINLDIVNCTLGIIVLVFCSDSEVEGYFQG
jgi:hypothetical protein